MMLCVHNALTALRLELVAFLVSLHRYSLIVGKEHHICPFLDERRDLRAGLFAELQLPAVVFAEFVGLTEFAKLGVCGQYHVHPAVDQLLQTVEETSEFLFFVNIAVTIAEILDTLLAVGGADIVQAKLLRPVDCINNKRLANGRIRLDVGDLIFEHRP